MIRTIGVLIGIFCVLGIYFGPSILFPIPTLDPKDNPAIEQFVIQHTNDERTAAGLPPLVHDPLISEIARAHSENMSRLGLSHDLEGREPTDRALRAGYNCRAYRADGSYTYGLSENILQYPVASHLDGFETISEAVAHDLVNSWMASAGHRANILDEDVHKIGVGIALLEHASDGQGWTGSVIFATQNFSSCR
ncbi:MAG: CAP domain-containing protein [Dehalococcoidia bacterium]|nr:CAP domain-containing protein [Dehalococcoidia bacterium]